MTYHVMIVELLTTTGGVVSTLYRVDAEKGKDAVAKVWEIKAVPAQMVYLLSGEETAVWENQGVKVKELV